MMSSVSILRTSLLEISSCNNINRGVARIFQRRGHRQGHHPVIADYIWFISVLSLVYQRAQSYYLGMKAHIN